MDARFECKIRANPLLNHYWMKNENVIESSLNSENLINSHSFISTGSFIEKDNKFRKYEIVIYNQNSLEYITVSALIIKVI